MKKHILTIVVSIVAGLLLLSMIGKKILTSPYKVSVIEQAQVLVSPQSAFSLFELAMAIKANDPNILLIDIRSGEEYSKGRLPNAVNVPFDKLFNKDYSEYVSQGDELQRVIYSNTEAEAARVLALLSMRGYANFKTLNGGYSVAKKYVVESPSPSYYHYNDEQKKYNYARLMPAGAASASPAPKEEVKIQATSPRGGC